MTIRPNQPLSQLSFPGMSLIDQAVEELSEAGVEERGAIFTRREVVEFILDLVDYTADRPLHERRVLEPSFGEGDFLLVVIERLLTAWQAKGRKGNTLTSLGHCIRAVELHRTSFSKTRRQVVALLEQISVEANEAERLADMWLVHGDFLLSPLPSDFDYVVGNPPYVRQEAIPDALMAEYRTLYTTIYDRADIYVPFIERSLKLLKNGGALGFICSDRWMKNRYGGPLRKMVADGYNLRLYVDMVDTPAFQAEVTAYPAITIIAKEKPGKTRVAHRPTIDKRALGALANVLTSDQPPRQGSPVKELGGVVAGAQPWILESFDQLALVRRLEQEFPTIEEAGCKVGIGVATGADKAFIGPFQELDVEPDRKLPLVMTRDILSGEVRWRGFGIVNPFADSGDLVELEKFPRLKRYLEARKPQIAKRHIAKKAPENWYRTIDRIYPLLASKPKLLIPDIKGEAHVVYEDGRLYPHHNLYFITSDDWDLKALQVVLVSGIARLFVSIYATRMRGGYLRFQAQYLRRIRLPRWSDVSPALQRELIEAAADGDTGACNRAAFKLYGFSDEEGAALGGNNK